MIKRNLIKYSFISSFAVLLAMPDCVNSHNVIPQNDKSPVMQESTETKAASDGAIIFKFMVDSKTIAEEEWEQQQEEKREAQVNSELDKQIKQYKKEKRLKAKKAKVKARAIKVAKERIKEIKAEAARFKKSVKVRTKTAAISDSTSSNLGKGTVYTVGSGGDSSVKSWEPHIKSDGVHSMFCTSSNQYKLQQKAYTGSYGIRMYNGRYCAAIGSRFTSKIGAPFDVVMENGNVIKCVLGDQKADKDTDSTNSYHLSDGSWLEFIVDRTAIDSNAKRDGNFNSVDAFKGKISKIIVY